MGALQRRRVSDSGYNSGRTTFRPRNDDLEETFPPEFHLSVAYLLGHLFRSCEVDESASFCGICTIFLTIL